MITHLEVARYARQRLLLRRINFATVVPSLNTNALAAAALVAFTMSKRAIDALLTRLRNEHMFCDDISRKHGRMLDSPEVKV